MPIFFNFLILFSLSSGFIFSPQEKDFQIYEPSPKRQRQDETISFTNSSQGLSSDEENSPTSELNPACLSINEIDYLEKLASFLWKEDNGSFFKYFFEYELCSHPKLINDNFYLHLLLINVFDRGISFYKNLDNCYEIINLLENIIENYNESHIEKYISNVSLITSSNYDEKSKLYYYQALLCKNKFFPHKPFMIKTNYKCNLDLETEEEHRLVLINRLKNDFKKLIDIYASFYNPLR